MQRSEVFKRDFEKDIGQVFPVTRFLCASCESAKRDRETKIGDIFATQRDLLASEAIRQLIYK